MKKPALALVSALSLSMLSVWAGPGASSPSWKGFEKNVSCRTARYSVEMIHREDSPLVVDVSITDSVSNRVIQRYEAEDATDENHPYPVVFRNPRDGFFYLAESEERHPSSLEWGGVNLGKEARCVWKAR